MNVLFIEAGHGRGNLGLKDTGAQGVYKNRVITERDFSKAIAGKVLEILKGKDLKDYLITGVGIETDANPRKKMQYVNTVLIENRCIPAKCFGVAIHMNSGAPVAKGWEIWYQKDGRSIPLSNSIGDSLKKYNVVPSRQRPLRPSSAGRYGRFYNDDAKCPYVIIETGFITNPDDSTAIWEQIPRVAESIAHGILEHLRKNSLI